MENSSVIWLITAIEQFLHFVNCDVRTLFSRQLFFGCCSAHARPREHAASQNSCSSAVLQYAAKASIERPCWEARHALNCSWGRFDTGKQGASRHPRINRTAEQPFTASLPAFLTASMTYISVYMIDFVTSSMAFDSIFKTSNPIKSLHYTAIFSQNVSLHEMNTVMKTSTIHSK